MKEGIDDSRKEGRTGHFASLMDICHFKDAELELPSSGRLDADIFHMVLRCGRSYQQTCGTVL